MPFLDSLDIANRVCQHCGVDPIVDPSEDTVRNQEIANAYDKLRRAELRRNTWRFSVKKTAIRAIDADTMMLAASAWSASKTYLLGEVVKDSNNVIWISQQPANLNNSPGGNNDAWDVYFGPASVDLFDSSVSYYSGELVYVVTGTTPNGYQVFLSLANDNSDAPSTATAWDTTVQYKQDDSVSHSGSQWRSLISINVGNTPADGPIAWASGTTYTVGQQVTGSDNYVYTATGTTTGNDPVTDGGVNWTNTGVLHAWSRTPTLIASSINWRPLVATLSNLPFIYPLGSGPTSQSTTRNVFRLPNGYLRKAAQDTPGFIAPLGGPQGRQYSDWEFDGDFILTWDTGPIILRFVADVSKVSAMDDMFCEGLAARIATAVCIRLTQSDSKLQSIASAYKYFMGEARTVNAIELGPEMPPDDDYLTVRY